MITEKKDRSSGPQLFRFSRLCLCVLAALLITIGVSKESAAESQQMDVVLVLDLSGSMNSTQKGQRFEDVFNWVKGFSAQTDRLAVVTFGTHSHLVQDLAQVSSLSFDKIIARLQKRAKYTDVAAGLEHAYYQLKNKSSKDRTKLVLLYSDGQIDLPNGMYANRNSERYLRDILIPAMKKEKIHVLAFIPDGLKANYLFMQELTIGTGGEYYRGLPVDAAKVRTKQLLSKGPAPERDNNELKKLENTTAFQEKAVKPVPEETPKTGAAVAGGKNKPVAVKSKPLEKTESAKTSVEESKDASSGTSGGFIALIVIFVVGFAGIIVTLIILLRPKESQLDRNEELYGVLSDIRSLKQQHDDESDSGELDGDELLGEEMDFGEPKNELSVSIVSPFIDFSDVNEKGSSANTDEIISDGPFVSVHKEPDLSLSMMETLIGTNGSDENDKEQEAN